MSSINVNDVPTLNRTTLSDELDALRKVVDEAHSQIDSLEQSLAFVSRLGVRVEQINPSTSAPVDARPPSSAIRQHIAETKAAVINLIDRISDIRARLDL